MDDKKQRVKVNWNFWSWARFCFLVLKWRYFCVSALAGSFDVDKDDDIEEEGDKDEGDTAEDPGERGCIKIKSPFI